MGVYDGFVEEGVVWGEIQVGSREVVEEGGRGEGRGGDSAG